VAAIAVVALLSLWPVGCGGGGGSAAPDPATAQPSAEPGIVERAVAIAREIEADPDSTEEILASHDLDLERFEAMLYEIGGDPELSKAYNAAME
jgi:hypothetical protein